MNDVSSPITLIASALPPWLAPYFAWFVGLAIILNTVSTLFTVLVRPPSATSAKWWLQTYAVLAWPALHMGWARNAVLPGMRAEVQDAALLSAKVAAIAPEKSNVVVPPSVAPGVIVTAVEEKKS